MTPHDDPTVGLDERELSDALRGLRPERDAFRAAVERRLRGAAEREAPTGAELRSDLRSADAHWYRRAAAWLPGAPLGAPLAGASSLSLKALPGLLALPALVFAMLLAPVFFALQSVVQRSSDESSEARARAVHAWWREHLRAALVVLALIGLLFLLEPVSAGVALLLVSAGVLALLLSRLHAAGFGGRAEVARGCAGVLTTLALWMALLDEPWRRLFASDLSARAAFCALAVAGAACSAIALHARHAKRWHLLTRATTTDGLLVSQILIFATWSALTWSTAARGRWSLESRLADPTSFPSHTLEWEHARATAGWLRSQGREPDLHWLELHWRTSLPEAPGERVPRLAAGIELGFVAPYEVTALADEARELLGEEGPLVGASLRERADVLALIRAGQLSEPERDRLAQRLLASRRADAPDCRLARLTTVVDRLLELGRPVLADGLREEARALLSQCWVPPRWLGRERAGFVVPRPGADGRAYSFDTCAAVELMLRVGVPDGIELAPLARALARDAWPPPWSAPSLVHLQSQLALAQARHLLRAHRGPLQRLLDERVLLATLVLAGFCLAATLRAPLR